MVMNKTYVIDLDSAKIKSFLEMNKDHFIYKGSWNHPKMDTFTVCLENECSFSFSGSEVNYINTHFSFDWGFKRG